MTCGLYLASCGVYMGGWCVSLEWFSVSFRWFFKGDTLSLTECQYNLSMGLILYISLGVYIPFFCEGVCNVSSYHIRVLGVDAPRGHRRAWLSSSWNLWLGAHVFTQVNMFSFNLEGLMSCSMLFRASRDGHIRIERKYMSIWIENPEILKVLYIGWL